MCCSGSKGPVRVARSDTPKKKSTIVVKQSVDRPKSLKPVRKPGVRRARSDRR